MKNTTGWKGFSEGGKKYMIQAEYGFSQHGDQAPYFSITGNIKTILGRDVAGGCLHNEISKHFPRLRHLIKWHLVAFPFEPMHYQANALYWLEKHLGISKWPDADDSEKALPAFKETIVWGVCADDQERFEAMLVDYAMSRDLKASLAPWLESRKEHAQEMFIKELSEAGIALPSRD